MTTPHENPAFVGDDGRGVPSKNNVEVGRITSTDNAIPPKDKPMPERDTWGKGIEFLLSCIAMSVGLGNVWRFPFTALDNGGGAFLIPYLVVLFLVGKPIYYLEMIIGQFSSRGSVKVFDLCPAMRGIGVGQAFMVYMLGTYYESVCALIAYYLVESFRDPLPWAYCRPQWGSNCLDSTPTDRNALDLVEGTEFISKTLQTNLTSIGNLMRTSDNRTISSSELFFVNEVLREKQNINDGIGWPNWELVLGLFVSWLCVFGIISRGVKSSGKASYFLAIFPYVIMLVLLIRAVTLPGSIDGIIYFIKPDWSKILDPKVWYAAVTQCFYSLSVCFGNIIMYASYNKFGHNVHRDATIVTGLDTCTSLLAGFTIFGILGHLAHEIGTDDIGSVVKGGAGLAFISYPDAIAKFKQLPQIFSVLFFLMLFVLGIGSNIAMTSCTVTAIRDNFPQAKQWQCALGIAIVSFAIGLAYVTPGGQFILTLVDYFGASMIALVLGIAELYCLGWVYGVDRLCKDAEFMMGRKVGPYWRWCWAVVTPLIMTVILIYFLSTYTPLTYNGVNYPNWAYAIGWTITCFGVLQLPIWVVVAAIRTPGATWGEKLRGAFKPKHDWGPTDPLLREQYNKEIANEAIANEGLGCWGSIKKNIFG
ncbi:sodium-dependent nutrient amino acid transporter 1 isoform X2 [Lucilia sericata]|uniref:sodium-dependent nutrient amino acid transporter 1 isoform X2 n=1 Tax=Lucilia sericata TaxID=13632 RepID=UPI0018A8211B|nr:sodium-dependent nutrient amino acid transporter 1 isoform X2 [Lucilia sericata]